MEVVEECMDLAPPNKMTTILSEKCSKIGVKFGSKDPLKMILIKMYPLISENIEKMSL
jgi:hypothetical protein